MGEWSEKNPDDAHDPNPAMKTIVGDLEERRTGRSQVEPVLVMSGVAPYPGSSGSGKQLAVNPRVGSPREGRYLADIVPCIGQWTTWACSTGVRGTVTHWKCPPSSPQHRARTVLREGSQEENWNDVVPIFPEEKRVTTPRSSRVGKRKSAS